MPRTSAGFNYERARATKTSTPTDDADIDVIHSLVKCLTQNEVPSPLPSSVRIYAFRLLTHWLSRRPGLPPPSLSAAFGPLSMLSSSILCLAKSSCKYEYMDHVSHFHVSASLSLSLSLSLPLPRSLTWWLLGGGGGFRRCRRRCRCRCHCRRHRCRQRLPSCVGGGGSSSSRESSFPLVISTADAAERDGQTKARKKRGREGAVPLPASPLSVSPQSLAIFWRAAAAASNPPLLPPSLPPSLLRRRRAFLRPSPG